MLYGKYLYKNIKYKINTISYKKMKNKKKWEREYKIRWEFDYKNIFKRIIRYRLWDGYNQLKK